MFRLKLARPDEIADLKALGYVDMGPSNFPGFIKMALLEPAPDASTVPDEETAHLIGAVAALECAP